MAECKNVMVSVVVAVYNSAPFLWQCLDSIANQTLRDIEVICVNDGSTDGSLDILEKIALRDDRFRVFSKENEGKGAASARNYGLERAVGKYLAILDSDDWFEPRHLEKLVMRAELTDAEVVICDAQGFDSETGNSTYNTLCYWQEDVPQEKVFSVKDYPQKIFQISMTYAWNCLFLRELVEKHKIRFQRIVMTDDLYFTFACRVLAKRVSVVNEKLIHYRMHSGISQSDGINKYPDSAYPAYLAIKDSLRKWGLYESVKQSLINSAANVFRGAYDRVSEFEAFERFHNELRDEIFPTLKIEDKSKDYFYDKRVYPWVKLVKENSAAEVAFKAARGYGAPMTTGILRFQIPEELLSCNIIDLRRGSIQSRYYYAQILFRGLEDKVRWTD